MNARELTHLAYVAVPELYRDRVVLVSGDDYPGAPRPSGEKPHIAVTGLGTMFCDPWGDHAALFVNTAGHRGRPITIPFVAEDEGLVACAVETAIAYLEVFAASRGR